MAPRLRQQANNAAAARSSSRRCGKHFLNGTLLGIVLTALAGVVLHRNDAFQFADRRAINTAPPAHGGGRDIGGGGEELAAARAEAGALRDALARAEQRADRAERSVPPPMPAPAMRTPMPSASPPPCPFCPHIPAAAFARGLARVARVRAAMLRPESCTPKPSSDVRCWPARAAHGPTGLTADMVARGRKHVGNVHRFRRFLCKLWSGEPTTTLVVGGSNPTASYAGRGNNFPAKIEAFLRRAFPVTVDRPLAPAAGASRGQNKELGRNHTVVNRAAGGTGVCLSSQMIETYLDTWDVDLVVTEFAINDGLDKWGRIREINAVHPPCFAGYQPLRVCTEAFVRRVYARNARVAIVHLELASWKTQFAGVGSQPEISNFYAVPMLSWRDAVLPAMRSGHGRFAGYAAWELVPCPNHGSFGAKALWRRPTSTYPDRGANYSCRSVWHKDGNHMGPWGHAVAADLFSAMVEAESAAPRRLGAVPAARAPDLWFPKEHIFFGKGEKVVAGTTVSAPAHRIAAETQRPVYKTGVLSTPYAACHGADLEHWGIKLMQSELHAAMTKGRTKAQVERMCQFLPIAHSDGFRLFEDRPKKPGWIAEAPDEFVTFELPLPRLNASEHSTGTTQQQRYDLYLVFLKSYEKVGTFDVRVEGRSKTLDALWERKRSTYEEAAVGYCNGPCNVTVATRPPVPGREGNKVKLVSLRAVLAAGGGAGSSSRRRVR